MKQLVYRSILGSNPKKREVSIEEINDRNVDSISRKWISKYFIRDKFMSKNKDSLKRWIKEREDLAHKNCHILRRLNDKTGENMMVCKAVGDFFVIFGDTAYWIVYLNEVRVQIGEHA